MNDVVTVSIISFLVIFSGVAWLMYSFWSVLFAGSRFTFMRKMARRFDRSHSVGYSILTNIRVTPSELENLSHDSNQYLRVVVAAHRYTPAETLRRLGNDSSPMVRAKLIENPHTPEDVSTLVALQMMVEGTVGRK